MTSGLPAGIRFGREVCGDLAAASAREWLCTNGLGSYASGTVAGSLTRRYHGLLVAALAPPLGRTLLVARLDEAATYLGRRHELSTNLWADGTVAPAGHVTIESFRLDGTTPTWTHAIADALIEKRVFMEQGAHATWIRWRLVRATAPLTLELKALVNHRDHHGTTRGDGWTMRVERVEGGLAVRAFDGATVVRILSDAPEPTRCGRAGCEPAHEWYRGYRLSAETERGLPDLDDHLLAGRFTAELHAGDSLTVACTTEDLASVDGESAQARRTAHEEGLLERWRLNGAPGAAHASTPQLVLAADQFVVARPRTDDPSGLSVIAGYPWFGDWGRDTMIALPGLALVTGRPDVSRRVLASFAHYVDRGMIPNRFPDSGAAPEYNTADATLWYVEAIRAHVEATDDLDLARELMPVLDDIVRWHLDGTRHGIGVDPADGLLRAGEPGVQLTWMDAKVGDRVVTPRRGKPVEINALWYCALATIAMLERRLGRQAGPGAEHAERARAGFDRFWDEERGCLLDVLDGAGGADGPGGGGAIVGPDASLRPNQILAVSLSGRLLDPSRQRRVVEVVGRRLLTSLGLRTLSPDDAAYRGPYEGGPAERDAAYHQGASWAWLIGPYVTAHLRVHGDRAAVRALLEPFADHVRAHGLGSIAELFDGDPPHRPRGCPAQAWSVAEVLRAAALLAG